MDIPTTAAGGITPGVPGIPDRCAPSAERRGDQLYATAAPVQRWLLLEQPGAWGRDALRDSGLDPAAARSLAARAATARVRVVLIRRPGRTDPDAVKRVGWVDSRPGREAVRWGSWRSAADLLALRPGEPPAAAASTEPVYLVCAHGRHDPCCAIRGRPVAAALAAQRPDAVWECSHVGGDRFAANVVLLPHGLYYGHVSEADAPGLVAGYEAGRVDPALLRGRSTLPAPAQAAEHHARLALGAYRLTDLPLLGLEPVEPGTWRVRLDHPRGPVTAVVRREPAAEVVRLTCRSAVPEAARTFQLVGLDLPPPTGPTRG
jgi:hypothetical protein